MRGLDPRIHSDLPQQMTLRQDASGFGSVFGSIDCRVKPGNDA
jgi:hypothetical protein